jgi:hypothetical protein
MIFKGFPIVHLYINDYFTLKLLRYDMEKIISVYFNTVTFTKHKMGILKYLHVVVVVTVCVKAGSWIF